VGRGIAAPDGCARPRARKACGTARRGGLTRRARTRAPPARDVQGSWRSCLAQVVDPTACGRRGPAGRAPLAEPERAVAHPTPASGSLDGDPCQLWRFGRRTFGSLGTAEAQSALSLPAGWRQRRAPSCSMAIACTAGTDQRRASRGRRGRPERPGAVLVVAAECCAGDGAHDAGPSMGRPHGQLLPTHP
jgi:hypothetical protein